MSRFYTSAEASAAIAEQIQPDNPKLRAEAQSCYSTLIFDDLCAGRLIGRDRITRIPISRRGLAGAIAFQSCLIAEPDLNEWLATLRVGVEVHNAGELPPGQEGDRILFEERERLKQTHGGRVPGGMYAALAKKFRIGERSAKHRCGLAEKRFDAPPAKAKSTTAPRNWNPCI